MGALIIARKLVLASIPNVTLHTLLIILYAFFSAGKRSAPYVINLQICDLVVRRDPVLE